MPLFGKLPLDLRHEPVNTNAAVEGMFDTSITHKISELMWLRGGVQNMRWVIHGVIEHQYDGATFPKRATFDAAARL